MKKITEMDSSSLECHCAVNGANKSLPLLFKLNWSKSKMLGDLEHILPVCNSRLLLVCSYTACVCFICCVLCVDFVCLTLPFVLSF